MAFSGLLWIVILFRGSLANEGDSALFRQYIEKNQNPRSCGGAYAFIPFNTPTGSALSIMSAAFVGAVAEGRTFLSGNGTFFPANPRLCPQRNIECYFLPLSWCPLESHHKSISVVSRETAFDWRSIGLSRERSEMWYNKEILQYMMRPNQGLLDAMDSYRAKLNLPKFYIAMHMRFGRKSDGAWLMNAEDKMRYTIEQYVGVAYHIAWLHSIFDVFISADEPETLKTLEQVSAAFLEGSHYSFDNLKSGETVVRPLKFYYIPFDDFPTFSHKRDPKSSVEKYFKEEYLTSTTDEGMPMLVSMMLTSQSLHFIGTLSSNLDRIVYQLMFKGDTLPSYFDMDNDLMWLLYGTLWKPIHSKHVLQGIEMRPAVCKDYEVSPNIDTCRLWVSMGSPCVNIGKAKNPQICATMCSDTEHCTAFTWYGGSCYVRKDGIWRAEHLGGATSGRCPQRAAAFSALTTNTNSSKWKSKIVVVSNKYTRPYIGLTDAQFYRIFSNRRLPGARGLKTGNYLQFIIDNYDELPEVMLFVENFDPRWIEWAKCARPNMTYFNLYPMHIERSPQYWNYKKTGSWVEQCWRDFLRILGKPAPPKTQISSSFYAGFHIMLSRAHARSIPIEKYQMILNMGRSGRQPVCHLGELNKTDLSEPIFPTRPEVSSSGALDTIGGSLECLQHVLFGEDLHMSKYTNDDFCNHFYPQSKCPQSLCK